MSESKYCHGTQFDRGDLAPNPVYTKMECIVMIRSMNCFAKQRLIPAAMILFPGFNTVSVFIEIAFERPLGGEDGKKQRGKLYKHENERDR